jgi:hypothetical protein
MKFNTTKINEFFYKFDNILPLDMFYRAQEEFFPRYTNWNYKKEETLIPEELDSFYPQRMSICKVNGDTLGWSLPLIEVGTRVKLISEHTLKQKFDLIRVNTNIQSFGQESTYHKDGSEKEWTFLVFLNSDWNAEWGGKFSIQLDDTFYMGITPLPNSGILFRGDFFHKGNAPNRLCPIQRWSAAYTFSEYNSERSE